ncbi:MAG: hypothetical protein APF81_13755 [Desulfosporosinus sp. BRH_c37]|nr:MAG: hypothetical protein APF81_13755 [Desulfosporosinus sp. BRH_c37]
MKPKFVSVQDFGFSSCYGLAYEICRFVGGTYIVIYIPFNVTGHVGVTSMYDVLGLELMVICLMNWLVRSAVKFNCTPFKSA